MSILISIDPGKKKCGLLLADIESGIVIEAGISSLSRFSDLVVSWNNNYHINQIIIGDGTNSHYLVSQLKKRSIDNLHYVNERGSTLRARFRYWQIWPPNILISWLPKELLFPPENLDAVVALILLEDFLEFSFTWPKEVNIKIWT